MPLVAIFFTAAFTKLFEYFAVFLTKKVALSAAAISVFIAALAAVFLTLRSIILGIMFVWPPSGPIWGPFYMMLVQILPSNIDAVIAALIAGDSAIFLYKWNLENVFKTPLYIT